MGESPTIRVCKADPIWIEDLSEGAVLIIADKVPDFDAPRTLAEHQEFFVDQAKAVRKALGTLPGGTLDSLFALMAADRASIRRVPTVTEDDELAWVRKIAAQVHERQMKAVGLHAPAEWNRQLCGACTFDIRQVPYPCPTLQALGIEEPPF
jgi:hypothetical protein